MSKKNIFILSAIILIAFLTIVFFPREKEAQLPPPIYRAPVNWSIKTIQLKQGWGFEIYQDSIKTILQKRIPAIPKPYPFPNEQAAKQVGEIMIQKIKAGKSPSVSKSELIELGLIDSLLHPIIIEK